MGFASALEDAGEDLGNDTRVLDTIPIEDLPAPTRSIVPDGTLEDSGAVEPVEPVDVTPTEPVVSTSAAKPGAAGGATTAVLGLGLGASTLLPMILNSSAVTGAIAAAAQVSSVAVVANDLSGLANNLISSITSSPTNMAIAGVAGVALLYLLFK